EAKLVAEKLRLALSAPYQLNGHHYHTTPSIGIVIFPFDNETAGDVLKHADTAMYRAKAAGRDTIRFYRPSMQQAADQRLSLEKDLRSALEKNQFELHYQPLLDNNNQLIGSEALLRWQHPDQGWVSPETFIPVAEESGLILMIGDWVMQQAIAQLKQWQQHDWSRQTGFLAINISARQFHQANFVGNITRILQQQQVNPDRLKLELTESLVIENIADTVTKMEALRELGVRIAIDDFGTGYSSLAYLKRLPIDQIKIDKSFVLDLTEDSNDAVIVETIISMANHLSLGIIAEGVETEAVLNTLKAKQCNIFQGYYFSKALPRNEFEQYAHTIGSVEPS
ncbi:MAG TPA: GGDEF domain-containing protein, partial [Candidatus Tenderia electrophaga]|nr:GGDEF domain-containing protein [Candidatus Tenderia electrophaga]